MFRMETVHRKGTKTRKKRSRESLPKTFLPLDFVPSCLCGGFVCSSSNRVELQQFFGDLNRIGRGALAEVVADAPEEQGVGAIEVLSYPADEDFVAARCQGGQGVAPGLG